jgi:hypothetical protein
MLMGDPLDKGSNRVASWRHGLRAATLVACITWLATTVIGSREGNGLSWAMSQAVTGTIGPLFFWAISRLLTGRDDALWLFATVIVVPVIQAGPGPLDPPLLWGIQGLLGFVSIAVPLLILHLKGERVDELRLDAGFEESSPTWSPLWDFDLDR